MRYNSYRTPDQDPAEGGLFESDIVLKPPPPYRPGDDDEEALRLAPPPMTPHPHALTRRKTKRGVPLPLLMAGWAALLGTALVVAYFVQQPAPQLDAQADLPAPAPAPSDAELGIPVTAPSIASQPGQFAAAAPAAGPAQPAPSELNIAEAPNPPPLDVKPAPPEPPEPPVVQAATETPPPGALKVEKAADTTPAKPKARIETADPPAKPKAAKTQTASAEAAPVKPEKALAAKDAAADAKSLPQLKARINRAYADAVKAGTPKSVLKARQAEWAVLRAKAEKKGPAAVEALYRTRAAELEAIAKKSAKGPARAA
jgi:hypothetical protein